MENTAVYYEVDVEVDEAVYDEYLPWLEAHVQKILTVPGFKQANLTEKNTPKMGKRNVVVLYKIASMAEFNHYAEGVAVPLREEAIALFGDKIKIMRRIFPENGSRG